MIGRLFQRLAGVFSDDPEDGAFAGSVLDWSVYYGHDGGRGEAAREMARIQEKAEILEQDHHRR